MLMLCRSPTGCFWFVYVLIPPTFFSFSLYTEFIQAYALVSVRLWFRLMHQKRPLTISDMFLLFATALVLVVMILFQKEHELGAMRKHAEPNETVKKVSTRLYYSNALCSDIVAVCIQYRATLPYRCILHKIQYTGFLR
jgi:hypothetical protein